MSSSGSKSASASEEWVPRTLLRVAILVMVICGVVVVLLYVWPGGDASLTPLRADILKSLAGALLQLIVLGVIGVALKSEFDKHLEQRKKARDDADRAQIQAQADAEKEQQRRNAVIELQKAFLRRVMTANRMVRKARILIPAHASAKTYGEQMRILIDAVLEFSDIRHEIETIPTFASSVEIREHLSNMERYLQILTEEYQERYQEIVAAEKTTDRAGVRAALYTLDACKDFLADSQVSNLNKAYMPSYWGARNAMRRDILNGLQAPVQTAAGLS